MAKRHYKTLRGLLSQTLYGQINFVDFHWNKFYHKKNGWVQFTLPDDEKEKGYKLMAGAIYSRNSDSKVYRLQNYRGFAHGILTGIVIKLSNNRGIRADYCACQDYDIDMRCIKGIFRNGN